MIRGLTANGQEIELKNDCGCRHEGPHWLYMDQLDRQRSAERLERMEALAEQHDRETDPEKRHQLFMAVILEREAYAREEQARCQRKLYHMKAAGIVAIVTQSSAAEPGQTDNAEQ